nr:ImmA/IrrE family metallo-endopeptidase [Nonomuraea sp. FMUSA5-5]
MRRKCDRLVRGLELPVPFDAYTLCEQVGAARGREILVIPVPMAAGTLHGVTLMHENRDVIVYQPHTTPVHQQHIILHELAHLLLGHDPKDLLRTLFPDLSPELVAGHLRTTFKDRVEYEAEYVATRILEKAHRGQDPPPPPEHRLLSRLERTLGRRPR